LYDRQQHIRLGFRRSLTPVVKYLIIFNASFFLVQEILRVDWFLELGLVPTLVWHGWVWQLVTYMFLHGGFLHILFNMFVLWMFGGEMERVWGSKEFLKYYFLTGIGAGICTVVIKPNSIIPTIGASGAVYGILLAYGLTFPNAIIYLYFLLPIKAKYFVLFFGVLEFIASVSPSGDMVAHLAHLGGMIFGFLYLKRYNFIKLISRKFRLYSDTQRIKKQQRLYEQEQRVKVEVDELLDKINRIGLENLSKAERKRLNEASRFLRGRAKP
jgi:membrane associated rhomboid family serine protease